MCRQELMNVGEIQRHYYRFSYCCFELEINGVIATESTNMYTSRTIEPVTIIRVSKISIEKLVIDEYPSFFRC